MTKLLFFSFRLMRATTQPSRHESTITITDTSSTVSTPPTIVPAVTGATIQYTITAGTVATALYISPSRYTPSSREAITYRTGIGIDSSRSLSLDRYRLEYVLNTLPNAPSSTAISPMTR